MQEPFRQISVNNDKSVPYRVPLNGLVSEPYVSILCYPKPTTAEARKRIIELRTLRISALEFLGDKLVGNVGVLGKGYVGIVVAAYINHRKVALKIRRVDADRPSMLHEARMLKKANSVHVGPEFVAATSNFLMMQLVQGSHLPEWLDKTSLLGRMKTVFLEILLQCRRLDVAGLDHGELSKAPKHVLVTDADVPFIVDFETASVKRRPSNVTSMCQYLFLRRQALVPFFFDEQELLQALQRYKKQRSSRNFEKILRTLSH